MSMSTGTTTSSLQCSAIHLTCAHQIYDPLLEQEGWQIRRRLVCSITRQHGDDLVIGTNWRHNAFQALHTTCSGTRRIVEIAAYANSRQVMATCRLNVKPPVVAVRCNMSPPAWRADCSMPCTKAATAAVQAACPGAGRHDNLHTVTARNMCARLQGRHGRQTG